MQNTPMFLLMLTFLVAVLYPRERYVNFTFLYITLHILLQLLLEQLERTGVVVKPRISGGPKGPWLEPQPRRLSISPY